MEDEVDRVDAPQSPRLNDFAGAPHPRCEAVGEIDGQKPVRPARRIHYGPRLRLGPPEWLLAEYRGATAERPDRLLRVQRTRRGDHYPVHPLVQQIVQCPD